jgi:hypothetical protein
VFNLGEGKMKAFLLFGTAMAATLASVPATAQVITDTTGTYKAGIGPDGELYDSTSGIGLQNPAGADYIAPGTPRDSWGITSSAGSAYADYEDYGTSNVTTTSVFSPNSAVLTSVTAGGLNVTQNYNFFASNILSIQETITNTTGATIDGIVFRRDVDLDIAPTEFDENIYGPLGANSSVVANSYDGFQNPDPAVPYDSPCTTAGSTTCNQEGDLGVGIDFGVGSLGAGQSATFAYYYGVNQPEQNLNQLFTQAQGLGLNYLIGAQSSENGDYPNLGAGAGFLGVNSIGSVAGSVPEPATWAMMLLGFGMLGAGLRYGRKSTTAKVSFA